MKKAKIGDLIKWSFSEDDCQPSFLRGKTFRAKVKRINNKDRYYGVWCSYGCDQIPFEDATIIK